MQVNQPAIAAEPRGWRISPALRVDAAFTELARAI